MASTAILAAFGGGIRWMVGRFDKQIEREHTAQQAARASLENQFAEQIARLEERLLGATEEAKMMRRSLEEYSRRVGVLEGLLRSHNIEVPNDV